MTWEVKLLLSGYNHFSIVRVAVVKSDFTGHDQMCAQ